MPRLWTFTQPTLGFITLACFATLLAHEMGKEGLPTVLMLYIQAGLLVGVTLAVGLLTVRCFELDDRAVRGVAVGCALLVWGGGLMGFARAVVVWKMQGEGEDSTIVMA